ncbi:oxidoreductase [Comamonas serinivorans]|uniref:Oxidoreductase n=1 Tax=Comamonas serinivorans TaxID=1082851 RepID=A0A1Y0EIC8_9BURK|nr:PDR/VanB family oxidoreductase [Comamonas serinivorans]ARU03353.1 oxidoreductase [Comamonas serinivorans]
MNPPETLTVQVVRRTPHTDDIVELELQALDAAALPRFEAGAHIDVHAGPGLVRQYSLCNPPADAGRYVIGVLRDPASRGGSAAIHERLTPGAQLQISAPRNHFPLQPARRSLLLAGGIGITPLLGMAHALHAAGTAFALHYCARSPARAAFLDTLAQAPFGDRVQLHFDDGEPAQQLALAALLHQAAAADDEVYVCGPAGFIAAVCAAAEQAGVAKSRVHVEYFSAQAVDTSGDGAFAVKLARSGQVFHIPADRSVTSVLLEAGIDIYTSCEEGTCGSCVTRVLEGEPEHRDVFLTDEEHASGQQFTPCCSRARTPMLVLDL